MSIIVSLFFQTWNDELLIWGKELYDGVSSLKFQNPEHRVWMPDIRPQEL